MSLSTYTRFFQGYFLPRKFNIDKKYGHLSDLINSKIINRKEALEILNEEDYSLADQNNDIE